MLVSPPIVTPTSCAVVEVESGAMLQHEGWERFVETYLFFKYHSKTDVGPGALSHSGADMRSIKQYRNRVLPTLTLTHMNLNLR